MNTHLLVHIFNLSFIAKLPCKFEKHFLFTAPSRRPIPNKFSLLLPHPGTNWTQFSPRSSAHRRREEKTGDVCRNTSVSRALYRRLFVYLLCRYEGRETRSNQMHFTIEFQAGEEESDSHLRGKREKKIWERETRGAWRSAATVSVCLMLIERCGSSCLNYFDFDITVSVPRTFRDYFLFRGKTVNYIWPFVHLNEKFERMKIYKM